jgi:vacuolar-type H+-ATPase subunit H
MAEKKLMSWIGFQDEGEQVPSENALEKIRQLESELAELRSRRDITGLSKEEFEILATETAMNMVRSAQAREKNASSLAQRIYNQSQKEAQSRLTEAEIKVRDLLSSAESKAKRVMSTAEREAENLLAQAEGEAESLINSRKREAGHLVSTAKREASEILRGAEAQASTIVAAATSDIQAYRQWLGSAIAESERLYRIQVSSLNEAQDAINKARERLDSAFYNLSNLPVKVDEKVETDRQKREKASARSSATRAQTSQVRRKKTSAKKTGSKKPSKKKSKK